MCYHLRNEKNGFYDRDTGAEAEDDGYAIGLEGRAMGPKGRAESHREPVPGLDT